MRRLINSVPADFWIWLGIVVLLAGPISLGYQNSQKLVAARDRRQALYRQNEALRAKGLPEKPVAEIEAETRTDGGGNQILDDLAQGWQYDEERREANRQFEAKYGNWASSLP